MHIKSTTYTSEKKKIRESDEKALKEKGCEKEIINIKRKSNGRRKTFT